MRAGQGTSTLAWQWASAIPLHPTAPLNRFYNCITRNNLYIVERANFQQVLERDQLGPIEAINGPMQPFTRPFYLPSSTP